MSRKIWFSAVVLVGMFGVIAQTKTIAAPASPAQDANAQEQQIKRQQAELDRLRSDWAGLNRYRADNTKLGPPAPGENRVVFMGDSITDAWGRGAGKFFPDKPYINRGISGQTTPQMLVRFRPDVIALKPKAVIILAGTNDVAGNTGPMTPEETEANIQSMVELAKANHIRVILASILPAYDFPWKPGLEPAGKIAALNAWIKDYAAHNGITYLDYYSAMVDERQGLKAELTYDGVHPSSAGYAIMEPLAAKAIASAMRRK